MNVLLFLVLRKPPVPIQLDLLYANVIVDLQETDSTVPVRILGFNWTDPKFQGLFGRKLDADIDTSKRTACFCLLTGFNMVELACLNMVKLASLNMVVDRLCLEQTVDGLKNEYTWTTLLEPSSGLKITAGHRTMTGQKCLLTGHFFTSPVILTGHICICLPIVF